jgi:glycosyltransferase involved in cell wall biosynthesis
MKAGIINLYPNLDNFGGAGYIAYELHRNLFPENKNFLMGYTKFAELNQKYAGVSANEYLRFKIRNVIKFRNYTFISHHRKTTTFLRLLSTFLFLNLKIIHVAHNEFYSLKYLTLFPKNVFCVSNKVKENLITYFGLKRKRIQVIHNGLADEFKVNYKKQYDPNEIRILYPAQINTVKQQLKIVEQLKGKVNKSISIDFAGDGEDFTALQRLCESSEQFNCIGFINIYEALPSYDYVMLFSKNEGLPLSLIEACMFQKPILANDVGGNLEILEDGINGFLLSSLENLVEELNELEQIKDKQYQDLAVIARDIYLKKFTKAQMFDNYRIKLHEIFNQ